LANFDKKWPSREVLSYAEIDTEVKLTSKKYFDEKDQPLDVLHKDGRQYAKILYLYKEDSIGAKYVDTVKDKFVKDLLQKLNTSPFCEQRFNANDEPVDGYFTVIYRNDTVTKEYCFIDKNQRLCQDSIGSFGYTEEFGVISGKNIYTLTKTCLNNKLKPQPTTEDKIAKIKQCFVLDDNEIYSLNALDRRDPFVQIALTKDDEIIQKTNKLQTIMATEVMQDNNAQSRPIKMDERNIDCDGDHEENSQTLIATNIKWFGSPKTGRTILTLKYANHNSIDTNEIKRVFIGTNTCLIGLDENDNHLREHVLISSQGVIITEASNDQLRRRVAVGKDMSNAIEFTLIFKGAITPDEKRLMFSEITSKELKEGYNGKCPDSNSKMGEGGACMWCIIFPLP
jgi:hypothetical protein